MTDSENRYELIELEGRFGEETRKEWESQISGFTEDEDLMLETTYRSKLKYALDKETDAVFYGLKNEENNHACAILELTVKMPETSLSGLRLLNITLEPSLDVENRQSEDLDTDTAVRIIVTCITEAFNLTFDEIPANTFKIYGRTERMQLILENVAGVINDSDLSGYLNTEMHGKWLFIAKNS